MSSFKKIKSEFIYRYYAFKLTSSISRNTLIYKLLKYLSSHSMIRTFDYYTSYKIQFTNNDSIIDISLTKPDWRWQRHEIKIRYSVVGSPFGYTYTITDENKYNEAGDEFIQLLVKKYKEIEDTVNQVEKSRIENFEEVKYNTERFKDYCEVYINGNNIHLSTKYSNLSELLEDIKIFREIFPNYQYSFFTKNIHINTITKSIDIDPDDLINVYLTSDVSISLNPKKCTPYNLITSNKDDYKITLNQTKD